MGIRFVDQRVFPSKVLIKLTLLFAIYIIIDLNEYVFKMESVNVCSSASISSVLFIIYGYCVFKFL